MTADITADIKTDPAAEFWRAIADRAVDAAFTLVAGDADVTIPPAVILGTAADEGREFFAATVAAFPDLLLSVKRSFTCSDGVAVTELRLAGTQAAEYLGAANQDKHLDIDQAWLMRVQDGMIRSITGYWDQSQLYRRLAVRRLDQVATG